MVFAKVLLLLVLVLVLCYHSTCSSECQCGLAAALFLSYALPERLKLSNEQITQLRVMLHQYNRGMQVQLKRGLELLQMSQESTSSLLSLKGEDNSQDTSESIARQQAAGAKAAARTTAAKAQEASKRAGNWRGSRSKSQQRQVQEQEHREPRRQQRGQVDGEEDEDSSAAAAAADSLAEQMQQHLSDRMQLMQVGDIWAVVAIADAQGAACQGPGPGRSAAPCCLLYHDVGLCACSCLLVALWRAVVV